MTPHYDFKSQVFKKSKQKYLFYSTYFTLENYTTVIIKNALNISDKCFLMYNLLFLLFELLIMNRYNCKISCICPAWIHRENLLNCLCSIVF